MTDLQTVLLETAVPPGWKGEPWIDLQGSLFLVLAGDIDSFFVYCVIARPLYLL